MTRPHVREYTGPRTLVLDVSHWQGEIDWRRVADAPSEPAAVIVRLGDGKDRDRRAVENLRGAKAAGLLVGAYRYLRAEHGVERQIAVDRAILDEAGVALDLPLCPDLEGGPDPDGDGPRKARGAWQDVRPGVSVNTADVLEMTRGYIEASYELTGLWPWLYTGAAWRDHVKRPEQMASWAANVQLWLAVGARGRVPAPWEVGNVVLHQYTAKGRVPGITGNVDLNHYHGSREQLARIGAAPRTILQPGLTDEEVGAAVDRLAAEHDRPGKGRPLPRCVPTCPTCGQPL